MMKCFNFKYGEVTELTKIHDQNIYFVTIIIDKENLNSSIMLAINPCTLIVDENLNEIELSDLNIGDNVVAYHSPIMTMSLPPQTQTYIIEKK